jgi:hypothetical protein
MQTSDDDDDDDESSHFVVVTTTYPTTYGCNRGRSWCRAELIARSDVEVSSETYETYEEAVQAALYVRERSEWFEDYEARIGDDYRDNDYDTDSSDEEEEERRHSSNAPLPWDSAQMENYDNDEEKIIQVMTIGEITERSAENDKFLETARIEKHLDVLLSQEVTRLQIKESGSVHYSMPAKAYDIPAELEVIEKEGHGATFVIPETAATIQTLMYRGVKSKLGVLAESFNRTSELGRVLQACTSLVELYFQHFPCTISKVFLQGLLDVAPHLRKTLKVLSIANLEIDPDAIPTLQEFQMLERLDLCDCFSTMHWDYCGDDDGPYPYDEVLVACVQGLPNLKRLDIGNEDQESRRYLHDYSLSRGALDTLVDFLGRKGAKVTLDSNNAPEDFSSRTRAQAARSHALAEISKNQDKVPPHVRELAEETLKTCPCKLTATKRCTACKRQWYCSVECQKSHFKAHKMVCKETF